MTDGHPSKMQQNLKTNLKQFLLLVARMISFLTILLILTHLLIVMTAGIILFTALFIVGDVIIGLFSKSDVIVFFFVFLIDGLPPFLFVRLL